jgi:hypothetical protein
MRVRPVSQKQAQWGDGSVSLLNSAFGGLCKAQRTEAIQRVFLPLEVIGTGRPYHLVVRASELTGRESLGRESLGLTLSRLTLSDKPAVGSISSSNAPEQGGACAHSSLQAPVRHALPPAVLRAGVLVAQRHVGGQRAALTLRPGATRSHGAVRAAEARVAACRLVASALLAALPCMYEPVSPFGQSLCACKC